MGLFKNMKDMKAMVSAAPDLIESAQKLQEQAQAQAQAAQGAAQGAAQAGGGQAYVNQVNAAAHGEPSAEALEPIAGVDLETYAKVVKGIAAFGNDASKLPEIAASHGIGAADWETAQAGWGARIQQDRALGTRFNALYTAP